VTSAAAAAANNELTITITHVREQDGRLAITCLLPGAQTFTKSIYAQESEQRAAFLDELCATMPGIDRGDVRGELIRIARATRIDLRWDISGRINGTAKASARLWDGARVIETASLNLLDGPARHKAIKHLAPYVAGKNASRKKLELAMRELNKMFRDQLQQVLTSPPAPQRPTSGFTRDAVPYGFDEQGINWLTKTREGQDVVRPLTSFIARIIAEISRNDGVEIEREFEIEATVEGKPQRFTDQGEQVRRDDLAARAARRPRPGLRRRRRERPRAGGDHDAQHRGPCRRRSTRTPAG
jgi:hypothetical protein